MTYTTGQLIQASDFNNFANVGANNLSSFWGTGTGNAGWGQNTTQLATLPVGNLISATQWATLVANLQVACQQSNTPFTSRTQPVAGTTVSVLASVQTDLNNAYANRGSANIAPTAVGVFSGSATKTTATSNGSNGSWTITFTDTVAFANTNAARYFFNAGGQLKMMFGKSSTGTSSDPEWNTFVGKMGNIYVNGNVTGSANIGGTVYTPTQRVGGTGGTVTSSSYGTGFYNLTTSPATLLKLSDDVSPYSGDYIQITANVDSNSSPTMVTLTTTWFAAARTSAGETTNISGGTQVSSPATSIGSATGPTTLVNVLYPATTFLSNTWGTGTVTSSVA